jgi:hypothetical protein
VSENQRADEIHRARVYLSEARRRRNSRADRSFYWTLLEWSARCRKRAAEAIVACPPAQPDLFA